MGLSVPASDSGLTSNPLSVIAGNIRGLNPGQSYSKIEYLSDLSKTNNSVIVTLTESHLSDKIDDSEVKIEGWSLIRSDRKNRAGGGVISYIKDHLTISNDKKFSDSMTEVLCVYIHELNIGLITVYCPPDCTTESFTKGINFVEAWMEDVKNNEGIKFLMTGDFNLGFLGNWNSEVICNFVHNTNSRNEQNKVIDSRKKQALKLLDLTDAWGLEQKVTDGTRKANILDLVLTNSDNLVYNIDHIKHDKLSDHDTMVINIENPNNVKEKHKMRKNFCSTEIPRYKTNNLTVEQIVKGKEFLRNQDWSEVTAESLTEKIEETVKLICDLRNPSMGKKFSSKNRIPRIVRLNLRRKQLASKALKTVKSAERCRKLKDKIATAEKELSKSYFKYKIDKENKAIDKLYENPKSFYTYVKSKTKEKSKIGPFVDKKGKVIMESPAATLQAQYSEMWSKPVPENKIDNLEDFFKDDDTKDEPKISKVIFTKAKIRKAIMKVRTDAACGPDGITPSLLKVFCEELLDPLESIYSKSMDESIFPSIWKKADVSPVKKSGKSKSKAESFRPVALLSHLGKVMEMIIREELQSYLEKYGKLAAQQHGFRSGKSCISQLLAHSEMVLRAMEVKVNIDSIYLDFQKAFDKADHSVILRRCLEKGVTGLLGRWIADYLQNRTQRVIANDEESVELTIVSGVPQGSVLGPLLFLILIDSITDLNITSTMGIFADDTRLIRQIWTELDAINLQTDVEELYKWADMNNMKFNGEKFECLKIGTNSDLMNEYNYTTPNFDGCIGDVESLRDLGVIVSRTGDYKEHIYKVVSKAKQRAGWISRSFVRNTIDFRRHMYRTYVQSLLDYGSQVWAPVNPSLISHLESVQRLYTIQTDGLSSYNYWQRLQKMRLQSVQRRMERYRVIYLWKIIMGIVPNFGIEWTVNSSRGRMITIPQCKSSYSSLAKTMREQSITVHRGKIFNLLPYDIRNWDGSKETFKLKLDEFLTNIPDHPRTNDLIPAPMNRISTLHSNSIYDWILHLKLVDRRPEIVP